MKTSLTLRAAVIRRRGGLLDGSLHAPRCRRPVPSNVDILLAGPVPAYLGKVGDATESQLDAVQLAIRDSRGWSARYGSN
jgi:hypothetical protein